MVFRILFFILYNSEERLFDFQYSGIGEEWNLIDEIRHTVVLQQMSFPNNIQRYILFIRACQNVSWLPNHYSNYFSLKMPVS